MLLNAWDSIKLWFGNHEAHEWAERDLMYLSIIGGIIIIYLIFLIIRKTIRDIKNIKKYRIKKDVEYIRKTSKHNKDNERTTLKFD